MAKRVEATVEELKRISQQLQHLKYGSVQITVHDGQIVQIDRTERSRFEVLKAPVSEQKRK